MSTSTDWTRLSVRPQKPLKERYTRHSKMLLGFSSSDEAFRYAVSNQLDVVATRLAQLVPDRTVLAAAVDSIRLHDSVTLGALLHHLSCSELGLDRLFRAAASHGDAQTMRTLLATGYLERCQICQGDRGSFLCSDCGSTTLEQLTELARRSENEPVVRTLLDLGS